MENIEEYIELSNVYGNSTFYKFYQVLSDSIMLIDWLREETHGMNNIVYNSVYGTNSSGKVKIGNECKK